MNKAKQRKLEAKERRKISLEAWTHTVEVRIDEEKKARRLERAKQLAALKGISLEAAMDLLSANRKKLRASAQQNNIELTPQEQGKVTVKASRKGKE